jgi:hypothetical protein
MVYAVAEPAKPMRHNAVSTKAASPAPRVKWFLRIAR